MLGKRKLSDPQLSFVPSFLLSLARPFLALHHHSSQESVDARLVTRAFENCGWGNHTIRTRIYIARRQAESPITRSLDSRVSECVPTLFRNEHLDPKANVFRWFACASAIGLLHLRDAAFGKRFAMLR